MQRQCPLQTLIPATTIVGVIEAYVLALATDEQRLNNLLIVEIMLPQLMLQQ
ncbi:MAG: hypothetical protein ACJASB_002582 [Shewanella psychromarinicola]|jgi:hypothetical protein